jgi:flagellar biosynthesis protein FlhF
MKIKKYLVKSFDEALSSIKRELGDDAFIMSTRKVEKRGALNLSSEEWVEVTAAVEHNSPQVGNPATYSPSLLNKAYKGIQTVKKEEKGAESNPSPAKSGRPVFQGYDKIDHIQPLREEISELKWLLQNQSKPEIRAKGLTGFTGEYDRCFKNLIAQGVERQIAERMIDNLMMLTGQGRQKDEGNLGKRLIDVIATHLGKAMPITLGSKAKLVALIGPTGVGKTTSIAKLAAYFKLLEGKRVALASLDGFRIGGLAQLRTYGDLIDVPVFAVRDQGDLAGIMNKAASYDLILIDTPGYSPSDRDAIEAMAEKMGILFKEGVETHLLLDATRKESDLARVYQVYRSLSPTHLIFSKIDETSSIGTLFNMKIQSGLPISYLTIGQRVPEDIEIAHPRRVASRLLGLFSAAGERT